MQTAQTSAAVAAGHTANASNTSNANTNSNTATNTGHHAHVHVIPDHLAPLRKLSVISGLCKWYFAAVSFSLSPEPPCNPYIPDRLEVS